MNILERPAGRDPPVWSGGEIAVRQKVGARMRYIHDRYVSQCEERRILAQGEGDRRARQSRAKVHRVVHSVPWRQTMRDRQAVQIQDRSGRRSVIVSGRCRDADGADDRRGPNRDAGNRLSSMNFHQIFPKLERTNTQPSHK